LKLVCVLLFVQLALGASPLKSVVTPKTSSVKQPKVDFCPFCVQFMDNAIDQILEIILNGGVIGSCGALCSQLPDQLEQVACNLICDYVGIEAFIDLVNYEDPDPIYICQVFDMCAEVDGGVVNITKTIITPAKGAQGTEFTLGILYTVIKPIGPGLLTVYVQPPQDMPLGDAEFQEGQAVGQYSISWKLNSQPSEQESFSPGTYQVQMAVCEGDCSNSHPYSGVYASVVGSFQITA